MPVVLPPVPDMFKVRITGTKGPDSWGIGMYLHANVLAGPYSDSQCSAVADDVFTNFGIHMAELFTTDTAIQRVIVEDLTAGSAGVGLSSSAAVLGTDAGTPLPSGVALCLNFGIASRYRGGHPRVYLPPAAENHLSDMRSWRSDFRHTVETDWNDFVSAVQTSATGTTFGLGQQAVRYRSAGVIMPTPETFDVLLVTASPIVASQRRRYNR